MDGWLSVGHDTKLMIFLYVKKGTYKIDRIFLAFSIILHKVVDEIQFCFCPIPMLLNLLLNDSPFSLPLKKPPLCIIQEKVVPLSMETM